MSGPHRPDHRGDVDRGTQLGTGTRLLASAFRLPVRATRAVGRGFARLGTVGRRGWLIAVAVALAAGLAAVAYFDSPATAARIVAVPAGVAVAIALSALAIAAICAVAVRIGVYLGRGIACVARTVWRAVGPAIRAIAQGIAAVAVVTAITIGRAIAFVAVPLGRAIAWVATHIGSVIAFVAMRVGRGIASVAVHVGRAVAFVAIKVGRAIAFVAVPLGRAVAFVTVRVGRAFAFVFSPMARGIKRAASAVHRMVIAPIGRALDAVAAALERAATRVFARIGALVRIATNWVRTRLLRMRHSVGVAAARARQGPTAAAPPTIGAESIRAAAPPPPFSADVFHNEYLPSGSRVIDAVITVTAHADPESNGPTPTAEVILVDCSGSMGHPWRKIRAARGATIAAIDALPDGALFAVVRANQDAEVVSPTHGGLAVKSEQTAADARRAVKMLWPEGGTAMGRWLLVARDLLATAPHAIGHAILLTDGKNESERPDELAAARRTCRGRFQCDCRGVGTDWDVAELRGIAQELLGTVDIVADPADLATDFKAMAERAAGKRVDGVTLRVWTPAESTVGFIKQVSPSIEDLGLHPLRIDARTVDYPTGAWSDESRDYHLSVELPAKPAGTEMLAARVSLVVGDRVLSKALVTATWTEDLELSTRIIPEVVHYTGQAELLGAVQAGLECRRVGDESGALAHLGDATRRAYETGNEATLQLIAKVVEIDDAPTGRVRVRPDVDEADLMALDTRSTRTKRFAPAPSRVTEPVPSVSSD